MQYKSCYGIILLCGILIIRSTVCAQITDAISSASLSGITVFTISIGELSPEVQGNGLKAEQLRTDVESKLQSAGINIIPEPGWIDTAGAAELYLEVNTLKYGTTQYSYCVHFSVIQKVSLPRNATRGTLGSTWSASAMGVVGQNRVAGAIREQVGEQLARLISRYLAANPPPQR